MQPQKKPTRARAFLFACMAIAFAGVVALVLGEIVLRAFPIPGIAFHSFYYDAETGGKYFPHTTLMFRGDDGVTIKRRANSWGFPDRDHEEKPAPGTLRIGFFGDSYTEALQVNEADMFVRRVENEMNARAAGLRGVVNRRGEAVTQVETLGFGVSGRGTLQSYQECTNWMARADLDWVVYVFVGNDPADQIPELKGSDISPYPVASGDTFIVDLSFNERYSYKTSWWHRLMQRIKSNSLVVSTLEGRLKLLKSYGVKRQVTDADRKGEAGGGGSPMAPSSWPIELVEPGWNLVERVATRWRDDVVRDGRHFAVVRVPREEPMLNPELRADTWGPRLQAFCEREAIPYADPTDIFYAESQKGVDIYHNHFTPDGHRVFSAVVTDLLLNAAVQRLAGTNSEKNSE